MSVDSSREQRRLAAEFIATARLITDIRASILAPAQKWLDLAEREPSQGEGFNRAAYLCDIQTTIGQELRARYDLSQKRARPPLTWRQAWQKNVGNNMRRIVVIICTISVATQTMAAPNVKTKTPIDPVLLEQASNACTPDVLNFCSEYIPDHDKITACLRRKASQLSPYCLKALRAIH